MKNNNFIGVSNRFLIVTGPLIFLGFIFLSFDGDQRSDRNEKLTIRSSNMELVRGFNWAKEKAKSYVQTGKEGPVNISERNNSSKVVKYMPSYWAGYPGRSAFYSRDFCHQASGAHLLGLEEENFSMLKAFALSADADKKWFPLWALNFDGTPFDLDYRSDQYFVREVPAVFELVETGYKLFQWTGDERYIKDEKLWLYYSKALTDFIEIHDTQIPNGVAEGTGKGIFEGAASYNESPDAPLIESGDAIASQYKAFLAYSEMAVLRGEKDLAEEFSRRASKLRVYFNENWGIKDNQQNYNRGYLINQMPIAGWGKENSWFLPLKGIVLPNSQRTDNYLDFIDNQLDSKQDMPSNIEALSYIPEVFFLHHRNDTGWKWMKYILASLDQKHVTSKLTGNNGDYPEISFVLVSNVIEGLMGINPEARSNKLVTLSHLPEEITFLGLDNINFKKNIVSVTHQESHSTTLKFASGVEPLLWEAQFPGNFDHILVNGAKKKGQQKIENGLAITYILLKLKEGDEISVTINSKEE